MKGYHGLERAATLNEQIVASIVATAVGCILAWASN